MTEDRRHNIRAIRELLQTAFNVEELRGLFSFAENHDLRPVADQFTPEDSKPAMVRKALEYCQSRFLLDELLAEIKDANPRAYARFEDRLSAPETPPVATVFSTRLPLPADLADFTGRGAQIDRVRDRLDQQGTVVINGMGGIGKTTLAVHVAHQFLNEGRFRDAQLHIDLKGTDPTPVDPIDALDSLINAVLEPDPNRPRDLNTLAGLWRQAIKDKDALLILDNAADAAQVRPLLPGCPTCAVLVTSRRRFTLPRARRLDMRPMQPDEARYLLQELAPHLDDDGADRIADLCGRLPQALRVAGNYLGLNDDVTPDTYAGMLADELARLALFRDPDDPDLDVYATIALSVAQLDADLGRAWALLSVFPAPFDLPAAAALWDQPEDQTLTQLQALRNRSLVTYDPESTRYHQHDLVRLAAVGDLAALTEGESHAAHLRMARHYEQVAREANRLYKNGGDNVLRGLALFDLEWTHIRAGRAWAAVRAGDDDEAARLCSAYPDAAFRILHFLLPPRDRIAWLESALRAARHLGDSRSEGHHLSNLGTAYRATGKWDRAIELYATALKAFEQLGNVHSMAQTYNNLGMVYADMGEWDRAIDYYQQALETYEQVGDIHGMARTYNNLGMVYSHKWECDRAIEYYEQSLETLEQVGDIRGMAQTYNNLGVVYYHREEWDRAIELYQKALRLRRQIGDRPGEAETSWNLGLMYEQDDPARAVELMEVCVAIEQEISHPHEILAEFRALYLEELRSHL